MNEWIRHIQMNIALESTKATKRLPPLLKPWNMQCTKRRAVNCMERNKIHYLNLRFYNFNAT